MNPFPAPPVRMSNEHFLRMRKWIQHALQTLNSRNTTTTICIGVPVAEVNYDQIGYELLGLESHWAAANAESGWHIDLIPSDDEECGCGAFDCEDYVECWHVIIKLLPPMMDPVMPTTGGWS